LIVQNRTMAVRMNMLKLLQEVEGLTDFPNRRTPSRPANGVMLHFRRIRFARNPSLAKRPLRVRFLEAPDIGTPVAIRHNPCAPMP